MRSVGGGYSYIDTSDSEDEDSVQNGNDNVSKSPCRRSADTSKPPRRRSAD